MLGFGKVYLELEQYERVKSYLQQSLKIGWEIGDRDLAGNSLLGFGNVYLELEQYERAKSYFQQSLQIAREINNLELETMAQEGLQRSN